MACVVSMTDDETNDALVYAWQGEIQSAAKQSG